MSTPSTASIEDGLAVHPDHPLDQDGVPIHWDMSPSKALGKLRAAQGWYARTGRFKTYIEKRAVMVGSKLCIEDNNALPFVRGVISDLPDGETYHFQNPCVDTPARVAKYNAKDWASTGYSGARRAHVHRPYQDQQVHRDRVTRLSRE